MMVGRCSEAMRCSSKAGGRKEQHDLRDVGKLRLFYLLLSFVIGYNVHIWVLKRLW